MIYEFDYEETLQGLDSVNRAEISSMIEKEIRTWVVENNGILNKLDKDKYVLFIEKQYVEQMEKNTFEILERVNELNEVLNNGYGIPNMEWVKTKIVELQNVVKENCTTPNC